MYSSRNQRQSDYRLDNNKSPSHGFKFVSSAGPVSKISTRNVAAHTQSSGTVIDHRRTSLATELDYLAALGEGKRVKVSSSSQVYNHRKQSVADDLDFLEKDKEKITPSSHQNVLKHAKRTVSAKTALLAAAGAAVVLNLSSSFVRPSRSSTQIQKFESRAAAMRKIYVDPLNMPSPEQQNNFLRRTQSLEPTKFAIVRPFTVNNVDRLIHSFDDWDGTVPCDLNHEFRAFFQVDILLSFSQVYANSPEILEKIGQVNKKVADSSWKECFGEVSLIECNVSPEKDLYKPSAVQNNPLWVNGPNRQFTSSATAVMAREYDAMFMMEADTMPRKAGWLDHLLNEIEGNRPFAILGSKYDGFSWDNYLEKIPVALLHHINGNAVYNTSHPLTQLVVNELKEEQETIFNAIPYDYRISQMMVQGSMGRGFPDIAKDFPFPYMKDENGEPIQMPWKVEKFIGWWDQYGAERPMRESRIISNFAATNFLPRHLNDASLVHGGGLYEPFDPDRHHITLVVQDWDKDYASALLSSLERSTHPFEEVVILRPPKTLSENTFSKFFSAVWEKRPNVPVRIHHRNTPDFMDVCDAPVTTGWFMMTNSYHQVTGTVDLMFTSGTKKPVVPYNPTYGDLCDQYDICKDTLKQAKDLYPEADKIILDNDMLFRTSDRDLYCQHWKARYGEKGERLRDFNLQATLQGPKGPSASGYVAFLYSKGIADEIYEFTDRTLRGAKESFIKIFQGEEKRTYEAALEQLRDLNGALAPTYSPPVKTYKARADAPLPEARETDGAELDAIQTASEKSSAFKNGGAGSVGGLLPPKPEKLDASLPKDEKDDTAHTPSIEEPAVSETPLAISFVDNVMRNEPESGVAPEVAAQLAPAWDKIMSLENDSEKAGMDNSVVPVANGQEEKTKAPAGVVDSVSSLHAGSSPAADAEGNVPVESASNAEGVPSEGQVAFKADGTIALVSSEVAAAESHESQVSLPDSSVTAQDVAPAAEDVGAPLKVESAALETEAASQAPPVAENAAAELSANIESVDVPVVSSNALATEEMEVAAPVSSEINVNEGLTTEMSKDPDSVMKEGAANFIASAPEHKAHDAALDAVAPENGVPAMLSGGPDENQVLELRDANIGDAAVVPDVAMEKVNSDAAAKEQALQAAASAAEIPAAAKTVSEQQNSVSIPEGVTKSEAPQIISEEVKVREEPKLIMPSQTLTDFARLAELQAAIPLSVPEVNPAENEDTVIGGLEANPSPSKNAPQPSESQLFEESVPPESQQQTEGENSVVDSFHQPLLREGGVGGTETNVESLAVVEEPKLKETQLQV